MPRAVGEHGGEDVAFAEVEVPVVGARDGELLQLRRRGGHGGRRRVCAGGRVDPDPVGRRRPEEVDRALEMSVRGDGGGDRDLH